jgi:hypothetical protein
VARAQPAGRPRPPRSTAHHTPPTHHHTPHTTTSPHSYKVYETFSLFSFTFGAILEDSKDNGTLPLMSVAMAGERAGLMAKSNFLTCGWPLGLGARQAWGVAWLRLLQGWGLLSEQLAGSRCDLQLGRPRSSRQAASSRLAGPGTGTS